jgi:hypothetical protein
MNVDQIAHDLAMAYINNRYGVNVTGSFSVESSTNYESDTVSDVKGEGSVETHRLPGLFDPQMVSVGTGKKSFLGIGPEKTRLEPTGEYAVDQKFRSMIADYHNAFQRFLQLLEAK